MSCDVTHTDKFIVINKTYVTVWPRGDNLLLNKKNSIDKFFLLLNKFKRWKKKKKTVLLFSKRFLDMCNAFHRYEKIYSYG